MKNKIAYYAQKIKSLQREKISLLKKSSTIKEQKRREFIKKTFIDKRQLLFNFFRLL